MTDGDDYWQTTAEMYGQLFQKPKMTQKLLCKPPFRYLHDIFTATQAATGYGDGLYAGAELDAKAITEKEAKINFLVKLIQLTECVTGEQLDVKPTKIVAGQEPERTNAFLQALFRAATAGIDTAPHVAQVLGVGGDEEEEKASDQDGQEDAGEAAARAQAEAQAQARAAQEQEADRAAQEAEAKR